jgi:hypothetical protein
MTDPSTCLVCESGHYLKDGDCFKCSRNCLTCDEVDKSVCLSCYANNFLVGNNCSICSP